MSMAWDERLITRAEVAEQVAGWPIGAVVSLGCKRCGQAITELARPGAVHQADSDDLMTSILRHMISAHDYHLKRRPAGDV